MDEDDGNNGADGHVPVVTVVEPLWPLSLLLSVSVHTD